MTDKIVEVQNDMFDEKHEDVVTPQTAVVVGFVPVGSNAIIVGVMTSFTEDDISLIAPVELTQKGDEMTISQFMPNVCDNELSFRKDQIMFSFKVTTQVVELYSQYYAKLNTPKETPVSE